MPTLGATPHLFQSFSILESLRTPLAVLCLLASCGGETRPPHNLLLVVVDTLRQDHLGTYGYEEHPTSPRLDAFTAKEAIRVDGLVAVSPWTLPSMATLFTGLPPAEHGLMRMTGRHSVLRAQNTLAERLQKEGWSTACVQSNFLMQKRRGTGLSRGFDFWDDSLATAADPHRGSSAAQVAEQGLSWLEQVDPDRPWFLVLHFFDPHGSYEDHAELQFADPLYQGWVQGGMANSIAQEQASACSAADRAQLRAYYNEEVRAVDTAFGEILDGLKRRSDWEDTVVVFTSDHGEELGERGYIGHTRTLHKEQVDLPLVVRLPKSIHAGTRVDREFSQTKLAGTFLHWIGVDSELSSAAPLFLFEDGATTSSGTGAAAQAPVSFPMFEVDFVPIVANQPEKRIRKRGLSIGPHRYWIDLLSGEEFCFDVQADPQELQNLVSNPDFAPRIKEIRGFMEQASFWEAD